MLTFDYALNNSFIDIPIIKSTIKYDIDACERNVKELVQKFISLQIKYKNIQPPKITRDYKVVYNDKRIQRIRDGVKNYVLKKIETEEDIKDFYNDFYDALSRLNRDEVIYFVACLYNNRSLSSVAEENKISVYRLRQVKNSCVIKLAIWFDKVAYKN